MEGLKLGVPAEAFLSYYVYTGNLLELSGDGGGGNRGSMTICSKKWLRAFGKCNHIHMCSFHRYIQFPGINGQMYFYMYIYLSFNHY